MNSVAVITLRSSMCIRRCAYARAAAKSFAASLRFCGEMGRAGFLARCRPEVERLGKGVVNQCALVLCAVCCALVLCAVCRVCAVRLVSYV